MDSSIFVQRANWSSSRISLLNVAITQCGVVGAPGLARRMRASMVAIWSDENVGISGASVPCAKPPCGVWGRGVAKGVLVAQGASWDAT